MRGNKRMLSTVIEIKYKEFSLVKYEIKGFTEEG